MSYKQVSDQEFHAAYYGLKEDPQSMAAAKNNRNVMNAVLKKYVGKIDSESLTYCGQSAMFRCLQKHDVSQGQKFTTSLYNFVHWECKTFLQSNRSRNNVEPITSSTYSQKWEKYWREQDGLELVELTKECMNMLPEQWQRDVLHKYYFEGLSIEKACQEIGVRRTAARNWLMKAESKLREIVFGQLGWAANGVDSGVVFSGQEKTDKKENNVGIHHRRRTRLNKENVCRRPENSVERHQEGAQTQ